MKNIMICGATSAIAEATARIFAQRRKKLFLVARDAQKLQQIAKDLKVRGAMAVDTFVLDINDTNKHEKMIGACADALDDFDTVLIAHGTLPDQKSCESNANITLKELDTNLTSTIYLLTLMANRFEKKKQGSIALISSVAGDRGRKSNYVYGTAKGALTIFMQGLRNRLYSSNVQVLTILPGFVDTPMTRAFTKGLLWTNPEVIAKGIVSAIEKKKNTVYLPWFWWAIMFVIRSIPESVFKKMNL